MSDDKPVIHPKAPRWDPDIKGSKRVGILDWSLDELIAYKTDGRQPVRIPDADMLFKLGSYGVSAAHCADLFQIATDKFHKNEIWHAAWAEGRAQCATRIRASLVVDALEKDVIQAKIHLDKMFQDVPAPAIVQVNVSTGLEHINTKDLLQVIYHSDGNEDTTDQ